MSLFQLPILCSSIFTSIGDTKQYFPSPITRTSKHTVWKHGIGLKFESKQTVWKHGLGLKFDGRREPTIRLKCICKAEMDSGERELSEVETRSQRVLQVALWVMEGVYISWLFLLPYAPVRDLMEASKSFHTLPTLLDHDVKRNSVRKAGSRSRNLLRVKQGMEMVKVLFEEILSTEGNSLKEPASTAFARVLASSQGWAVRKAVAAGLYSIPTKDQLFKILNEDEDSFRAQMQRYIAASTPVIQYVDHLFLARNLGIKW